MTMDDVKIDWQKIRDEIKAEELWDLCDTIAEFVYPRLLVFRDNRGSYPPNLTPEAWDDIIGKMVEAFRIIATTDTSWGWAEEEHQVVAEGLKLFGEWFMALWY